MAWPMSRPPPVTSATLPVMSNDMAAVISRLPVQSRDDPATRTLAARPGPGRGRLRGHPALRGGVERPGLGGPRPPRRLRAHRRHARQRGLRVPPLHRADPRPAAGAGPPLPAHPPRVGRRPRRAAPRRRAAAHLPRLPAAGHRRPLADRGLPLLGGPDRRAGDPRPRGDLRRLLPAPDPQRRPLSYSARRATMGATESARRAASRLAVTATAVARREGGTRARQSLALDLGADDVRSGKRRPSRDRTGQNAQMI